MNESMLLHRKQNDSVRYGEGELVPKVNRNTTRNKDIESESVGGGGGEVESAYIISSSLSQAEATILELVYRETQSG